VSSPADDLAAMLRTLARKAAGDATAAREFAGNPDITDEIIGFQVEPRIAELGTYSGTRRPDAMSPTTGAIICLQ
jgi:hypothetical protein